MRLIRGAVCFAICACCAMFAVPARAANPLQVKTDKGKVQGKMSDDGQVRIFLGIPYAAPPVGNLRWRPPLGSSPRSERPPCRPC